MDKARSRARSPANTGEKGCVHKTGRLQQQQQQQQQQKKKGKSFIISRNGKQTNRAEQWLRHTAQLWNAHFVLPGGKFAAGNVLAQGGSLHSALLLLLLPEVKIQGRTWCVKHKAYDVPNVRVCVCLWMGFAREEGNTVSIINNDFYDRKTTIRVK